MDQIEYGFRIGSDLDRFFSGASSHYAAGGLSKSGVVCGVEQDPERVDAERGAQGKTEEMQRAEDDGQDASPLLIFQQTETGDDPRNGDDQKDHRDGHADRAGDEQRLAVA